MLLCPMKFSKPEIIGWPCEKEQCAWWETAQSYEKGQGRCAILSMSLSQKEAMTSGLPIIDATKEF